MCSGISSVGSATKPSGKSGKSFTRATPRSLGCPSSMGEAVIEPRGPFSVASEARFIAGWPPAARPGAAAAGSEVRLGFLVDDWSGHAGVVLRQDGDGPVRLTIEHSTAADDERAIAQAARIVSLDHDGEGYAALGARDEVVGQLKRASG